MDPLDFDRVLDCAAEVFALHGFSGVGMRELSTQCKVSVPTLYHYFGSKEKLFEAACHNKYRQAIEYISGTVDAQAGFEVRVEQLGGQLFDLLTADRTLFLLLRRDLVHGSISSAEFRSQLQYEGMIGILRQLLLERHTPADADRLAFTGAALIFGYCEFVHVSRNSQPAEAGKSDVEYRGDLIKALRALTG